MSMNDSNECHVCLLPANDSKIVKLIRLGDTVYKFTIKNGEHIRRFREQYGDITIQQKLQNIMLYILKMDEQGPAEVQLSTSLFIVKIDINFWALSNAICFENTIDGTRFKVGKLQYYLCIMDGFSSKLSFPGIRSINPEEYSSTDAVDFNLIQRILTPNTNQDNSRTFMMSNGNMQSDRISTTGNSSIQEISRKTAQSQGDVFCKDNKAHKDIIQENELDKERINRFPNKMVLDKLMKKQSRKSEGFFTRLFGFFKLG